LAVTICGIDGYNLILTNLALRIRLRLLLPLLLIGLAWLQELVDQLGFAGGWNLPMGPGTPWWTLLTAPFSHSGFVHLLSNTLVFLPLSWLVLSKGLRPYLAVWIGVLFMEIPVWLFWSSTSHGLSGVVYGLLGYLLLIGFLERRLLAIALTVICFVLYGSALVALLPWQSAPGVSWIGHASGFVGGLLAALGIYQEPTLEQ